MLKKHTRSFEKHITFPPVESMKSVFLFTLFVSPFIGFSSPVMRDIKFTFSEEFSIQHLSANPELKVTLSEDKIPENIGDGTLVGVFQIHDTRPDASSTAPNEYDFYLPYSISGTRNDNSRFEIKKFPSGFSGVITKRSYPYSHSTWKEDSEVNLVVGIKRKKDVKFARKFKIQVQKPVYMKLDPKPISIPEDLAVGSTVARFVMEPPDAKPVLVGFHVVAPMPQGDGPNRTSNLFIRNNGELWGVGENSFGQLGTGKSGGQPGQFDPGIELRTPTKIIESGVRKIWARRSYSVYIGKGGSLWLMGAFFQKMMIPEDQKNRLPKYQYKKEVPQIRATPVKLMNSGVKNVLINYRGLFIEKDDGSFWWQKPLMNNDGKIPAPEVIFKSGVSTVHAEEGSAFVYLEGNEIRRVYPKYDSQTKGSHILVEPIDNPEVWLAKLRLGRMYCGNTFYPKHMYSIQSDGSLIQHKDATQWSKWSESPTAILPNSNRPKDTHNHYFRIDGDRLILTAPLNFENLPMIRLYLKVIHPERGSVERLVQFRVNDVPEAPARIRLGKKPSAQHITFIGASARPGTLYFKEDSAGGEELGFLIADDSDFPEKHRFQLVPNPDRTPNDNALFSIKEDADGHSVLCTRPGITFDFETRRHYSLTLQATDKDGLTLRKKFPVEITDVNEPPREIQQSQQTFSSDAFIGSTLTVLTALDDAGDEHTFELLNSPHNQPNDNPYGSIEKAANGFYVLKLIKDLSLLPPETDFLRFLVSVKDRMGQERYQEITLKRRSPLELYLTQRNSFSRDLPVGTVVGRLTSNEKNLKLILPGIAAFAAGDDHSAFILGDGSVWAMGSPTYDQWETPKTDPSHPPLSYSQREALKGKPVKVHPSGARYITAGSFHTLFIKNDGSLWMMGRMLSGIGSRHSQNARGKITDPIQIVNSGVVDAAIHDWHLLYVKSDGSLWGWGESSGLGRQETNGAVKMVNQGVTHVSTGNEHSLYTMKDGSMWGLGLKGDAILGLGGGGLIRGN